MSNEKEVPEVGTGGGGPEERGLVVKTKKKTKGRKAKEGKKRENVRAAF